VSDVAQITLQSFVSKRNPLTFSPSTSSLSLVNISAKRVALYHMTNGSDNRTQDIKRRQALDLANCTLIGGYFGDNLCWLRVSRSLSHVEWI
jgi:hypothetical protein